MSDPTAKKPADASSTPPPGTAPVVVKKYANRRLYNTESSSYITLENLAEMIRKGRDFVVKDAKTEEDITRQVLTQIIVEEEGKGSAMLPTTFLRQLIGMYGEDVQGLVPRYLEQAMDLFARQQEQMRSSVQQAMSQLMPPGMADMAANLGAGMAPGMTSGMPAGLEELGRQNMAMMERAMSLFSPFHRPSAAGEAESPPTPPPAAAATPQPADVAALRAEVENLRIQLAAAQAEVVKPTKSRGRP